MASDDLYAYNASDSSINLSPVQDKKLVPCEIAGLIMLIFKGKIIIILTNNIIYRGLSFLKRLPFIYIKIMFQNEKVLVLFCIATEKSPV